MEDCASLSCLLSSCRTHTTNSHAYVLLCMHRTLHAYIGMTCFLSTALWNTACAAVVAALVAAQVANSQVYQLPWWHPTLQAMARSHITKSDHSPVFSLINRTIQRFTRESHNGDIDCPRGYLCDGE